ncbi:isochorismatase family cysteine hydrolase [Carboxydochorda subterranea]|uniref:Isochorismatase family cysteine hydrolase n=1 Tax=Carboxydichorda subterranea TaxID=3109565 RepID=A0ABZ1BWL6_9FIRM|nr:isochorismatase family cysteine hydrolase [Limnochorda sp. L945t]WRP16983.1 isochorismatase family cysteine hydrolase [Limnochorda sp. L945t]
MSARTVEVPEYTVTPRVELDPERTALVVVDMQNDFCRPEGKLFVPDAPRTVGAIARLLELARSHHMPVFFTQDWHRPGDPEFAIWGEHVLEDTWGARIIDELAPRPGERVIRKVRYDAFYGTSLDHDLRLAGADTLIICGTVANICVHYTAASAALRWYKVVLPVDAISALAPFDMESALRQVSFLFRGILTRSDGIVAHASP